MREARWRHTVLEARGGIVLDHEGGVVGQGQRSLLRQIVDDARAQGQAGRAQPGIAGMHGLDLDRDVVFELRAVGGVQVHGHQRVPALHQLQHRLHLGRVGLQVVAVEVVVLRGGAPAHFLRPALVGTVPGAEPLVAVHVEDGHEHPDQLVQCTVGRPALQYLAQREEAGILSVDLTGVDAALDQHHRQAAPLRLLRRQGAAGGGDQGLHRAAFGRGPERGAAHGFRILACEGVAQRGDFLVASGLAEPGSFGHGGQCRLGVRRRCQGQQEGGAERTQHGEFLNRAGAHDARQSRSVPVPVRQREEFRRFDPARADTVTFRDFFAGRSDEHDRRSQPGPHAPPDPLHHRQ